MGELEARPGGLRCAPQPGPGSPQHPQARTCRPQLQGRRLSGPTWAAGGACRATWATTAPARTSQMSRAESQWPGCTRSIVHVWPGQGPTGATPCHPDLPGSGRHGHWDFEEVCCGGLAGQRTEEPPQVSPQLEPGQEVQVRTGQWCWGQDSVGSTARSPLAVWGGAAGFLESRSMS